MYARTLLYKGFFFYSNHKAFGQVHLVFLLFNIITSDKRMHRHQTRECTNTRQEMHKNNTSLFSLGCVSLMEHNVSIPMNSLYPSKNNRD